MDASQRGRLLYKLADAIERDIDYISVCAFSTLTTLTTVLWNRVANVEIRYLCYNL